MKKIKHPHLYSIIHEQFATDRYVYGTSIVEATSKESAMKKLNDWLATKPNGLYTDLPCKSINHVSSLKYIK